MESGFSPLMYTPYTGTVYIQTKTAKDYCKSCIHGRYTHYDKESKTQYVYCGVTNTILAKWIECKHYIRSGSIVSPGKSATRLTLSGILYRADNGFVKCKQATYDNRYKEIKTLGDAVKMVPEMQTQMVKMSYNLEDMLQSELIMNMDPVGSYNLEQAYQIQTFLEELDKFIKKITALKEMCNGVYARTMQEYIDGEVTETEELFIETVKKGRASLVDEIAREMYPELCKRAETTKWTIDEEKLKKEQPELYEQYKIGFTTLTLTGIRNLKELTPEQEEEIVTRTPDTYRIGVKKTQIGE